MYNLPCKHCGHNEGNHTVRDNLKKIRGYQTGILDCPGYEAENKELEAELAQNEAAEKIQDALTRVKH